MKFYFPGNFKVWLVGCLILVLTASFGLNFFLFKINIMDGILQQLTNENNRKVDHIKKKLDNIINEHKNDLNKLSSSYSNTHLGQKKDNTFITEYIREKWNSRCKINNNCQLIFHDSDNNYHEISEKDDPFSTPSAGISKLSLNLTGGEHLFSCNKNCYLHITKPLSSYDLKNGLMEISIHADYLIDEISKELYGTDLVFLMDKGSDKKSINFKNYNKNNYSYLGSTNHTKFERIDTFYNKYDIHQEINKNLYIIKKENKNFIFGLTKYENLTIINTRNIDELLGQSSIAINKFIHNSLIILILVVFVFYFLLSYSMRKIDTLSEILHHIGDKDFKIANTILRRNMRTKIHDEIDNIYNSVFVLSNDLETTLDELGKTNKHLTKNIEETRLIADHDALTGLYNRRRFSIELESTLEAGNPFFLISADLNHFKLINDSLGHSAGDELLINFSKILRKAISNNGIIGRMGGDEFSIIISGENEKLTATLLNDISKKTAAILKENSFGIKVSTSIGVARYPLDSDNIEGLSAYSDVAMYENKRFKTDAYNYYNGSETIVKEEREAQVWQNLINKNLQESNLIPYQQPIVSSKDHTSHAYEILVRIQENSKILPSADFIHYAEKNRTIIQIDRYIIKQALKYYSDFDYPRLTINLSYLTIATSDTIEYIIECKNNFNYPAEKIIFEITETTEISNILLVQHFIDKLKKHGFFFALDDFGSGFSSFYYLANLGIDYIKLDKSLTTDLPSSKTAQHIVKSITELAKDLNIAVIAEGIENELLLNEMSRYNIDYLQGYYFSKPKPLSEYCLGY